MRRLLLGLVVVAIAAGVGLSMMAARHVEKIQPGTYVGMVPVGGLTQEEAAFKLRQWWEAEKVRPIGVKAKERVALEPVTPAQAGIKLDDEASVEKLPLESYWQSLTAAIARSTPKKVQIDPVLVEVEGKLGEVAKAVDGKVGDPEPARAFLVNGQIVTQPERVGFALDKEELQERVREAVLKHEDKLQLPLHVAEKHVPDEALESIKDVVSEFGTSFSSYNRPRSSNIKLASSKLNGIVLMPGDKVSYNDTVGRRTQKNGFKIAGVYRNGKHDFDVGGGICQVSTTLYNAALFANLRIVRRQNHSMPVAYVPVGRDATVDYGVIDLVIENTYDTPVAITSEYKPGRLVFRILGTKDPSLSVKLVTEGHKTWDTGAEMVIDRTIAPGKHKVVEKGCKGHSINSYRLVYRGDKLVARESLGKSFYKGAKRVVAVGAKPSPATDAKPAIPVSAPLGNPD